MLVKVLFNGGKRLELSDGAIEVFIELVSLFFILIEEESLENDGRDQ